MPGKQKVPPNAEGLDSRMYARIGRQGVYICNVLLYKKKFVFVVGNPDGEH